MAVAADIAVINSNDVLEDIQGRLENVHVSLGSMSKIKMQSVDKSDRATSEQVMDPRTRMILFKMINKGLLMEINGCISTGKEANVYHAVTEAGEHRAIKIYKTSILVFKDRDRYVSGEYRFRQGYSKHNPRKMVKVWAEKELRNLKRLQQANIPCPEALLLKDHVLLMTFLGTKHGWAYPRLKDVTGLEKEDYERLYRQTVGYMRILFHRCRLVHADLSEFNMLYGNNTLYIIDVSQSVEHDHPNNLEFLRMDIVNVTDFFRRKNVHCLPLRRLFDFVLDNGISTEIDKMDKYIEHLMTEADQIEVDEEDDEVLFRNAYIPQRLEDVYDVERDINEIGKGGGKDLIYSRLLGNRVIATSSSDGSSESETDGNGNGNSSDESGYYSSSDEDGRTRLKHYEDKDDKKARKSKTKEENRERRQHKMPKRLKRQLVSRGKEKGRKK